MTQQTETDALDIDQLQLDRLNFKKWWHLEKQRADKLEGDNASLYAELEELRARTPEAVKVERIEGQTIVTTKLLDRLIMTIKAFLLALKSRPDCIHIWPILDEMIVGLDEAAAMTGKGE